MTKQYAPHPYQLRAIQLMCSEPGACLFLDPGMGKTSITLAGFTVLKEHGAVNAMLVVAPRRPARLTWPQEVAKWADFNHLRVSLVLGSEAERIKAMGVEADIYVINPENTRWLAGRRISAFANVPDMLVVDESTKFKNAQSVRFKELKPLLPKFVRRYILTGTPAPQAVEDLFGQTFLVDEGQRLGRFVTHFRKQFCDPTEVFIGGGRTITKWHAKKNAPELVYHRLNDIAMHLKAEDYLQMPDLSYNNIPVELPRAARAAYEGLAGELYAKLSSGTVLTAPNAAAVNMKLRQITNGWVYSETGSVPMHDAKLEALVDLVEQQQGTPLLVAVAFLHEVPAIREALGDKSIPYLGGGVSDKEADRIVADWNAGKLPVLLAHPSSVAHGLNLQAGGHAVCWFGLTWALEDYLQFNRRVYRQGQDHPVVIHHIVAAGTVDESIAEALQNKDDVQSAILNSLKGN